MEQSIFIQQQCLAFFDPDVARKHIFLPPEYHKNNQTKTNNRPEDDEYEIAAPVLITQFCFILCETHVQNSTVPVK